MITIVVAIRCLMQQDFAIKQKILISPDEILRNLDESNFIVIITKEKFFKKG